jgi:hypothetical protein
MKYDRCRWVRDKDVPGGRFLIPGCWNRAVYGDHAECHCHSGPETIADKLDKIMSRLDKLEQRFGD